ncbi:MAG: hypothetical protein MJZ65_05170 [Paludibacteraceae bacterium]|nr:hypothetical protein [Paludibacteraceae bacterium]
MNENKKITLQEFLNGEILTREWFKKQYALFLLIGGLTFVYIFLGYQAQRQYRHLIELQEELQDKQFKQLTIEAELTELTRESAVSRALQAGGSTLQENKKPLIRL